MFKSCKCCVVSLKPNFSFLLWEIVFRLQNFCWSLSLYSVFIQKPVEKSYWLFVRKIRVMLTSGLAYKIVIPLYNFINNIYVHKL